MARVLPVESVVDLGLLLRIFDLLGLSAFAVSGALLAIERRFDIVGIVLLAVLTAVGGGILRDLVLGDVPPLAFRDVWYLLVPVAAAIVAFFGHQLLDRARRVMLVFDAAGLGLFAVTGTVKALAFGLNLAAATTLGVLSAVGGGLIRDVIARETPTLVRSDSVLYAVPAFFGALGTGIAVELGTAPGLAGAVAAAGIFTLRVLALRRRWRAPLALGVERDT
jgi:uncharacterized membrane protein YeiH